MDENAFQQMAPGLWQKALQTGLSLGATAEEAEDTAQDVMLRLWQMRHSLHRFRSLEAVCVVMARNMTLNNRRRQPILSLGPQAEGAGEWRPDRMMEEKEDEEWLERQMSLLPSTQHTILHMRQVEHRTIGDIAALLGIGEPSVRTLLSRARHTLLEEIKRRR